MQDCKPLSIPLPIGTKLFFKDMYPKLDDGFKDISNVP